MKDLKENLQEDIKNTTAVTGAEALLEAFEMSCVATIVIDKVDHHQQVSLVSMLPYVQTSGHVIHGGIMHPGIYLPFIPLEGLIDTILKLTMLELRFAH